MREEVEVRDLVLKLRLTEKRTSPNKDLCEPLAWLGHMRCDGVDALLFAKVLSVLNDKRPNSGWESCDWRKYEHRGQNDKYQRRSHLLAHLWSCHWVSLQSGIRRETRAVRLL